MLASPDDTLCMGESALLNASGASLYVWSPPQGLNSSTIHNPVATPTTTTLYQVIGYDGKNCFTDTGFVKITVGPRPTVNLGSDLNLSTGTITTLNAVIQNGPIISWAWTPSTGLSCTNCPSPVLKVTDNISYQVTVTNNYGCVATDNLAVFTFCKNSQVFIPNAFTPDGDGLNDVLMVRGTGISVKSFRIFNRWGELVFERQNFNANDKKYGWDGKVKGVPASPDVFVYTAEVICDNGVQYIYKGNSTLLK
jgi:large repetitive protein